MKDLILREPFAQKLLKFYRAMQSLVGDEELGKTLSAARNVANSDRQIVEADRVALIAAYDAIERALLGPSLSQSSDDQIGPPRTSE